MHTKSDTEALAMNVEYFREGFELLSYAGAHLLNEEEKALLENALVVLQSTNQLHKIFFWGRICAVNGDYYIAFGYLKDSLRGRRFFFSKDCVQWFLLPPANTEHYLASLLAPEPLSGDISEIHEVEMVIQQIYQIPCVIKSFDCLQGSAFHYHTKR